MQHEHELESAILTELEQHGPCTVDELIQQLTIYTWNQVFVTIDRLSREGTLLLQRRRGFEYTVSVGTGGRGDRRRVDSCLLSHQ